MYASASNTFTFKGAPNLCFSLSFKILGVATRDYSGAIEGAAGYRVAVEGKIIAEEMRINLEELEKEIKVIGHLPGVPSASEVATEGILLGDMQKILVEKIEELTLHTIALKKEIEFLKSQVRK